MSYPRRGVILSLTRKSNPYVGVRLDASVFPNTVVPPTVPRKIPSHSITGHPSGAIVGKRTIVPSAPVARTVVPTIIPTPAALRNATVVPPGPISKPQSVLPGSRQPTAVVGQPAVNHRRHARGPPVPGAPVGRGHRGHNHGVVPHRR